MRRALVLASLLVTPALSLAQVAGGVVFLNGREFPMYVNATECQVGHTVLVAWKPVFLPGYSAAPSGAWYAIYGSNQDPATNPTPHTCFNADDTSSGRIAAQVPDVVPADNPIKAQNAVIDPGVFIAAAGKSCADDGATVWICVQGYDPAHANAPFGFSSAAVTISTALPPAPVLTEVTPGAGSVQATWEPGAATSAFPGDSHAYQLTAEMVGTTTGASDSTTHFSPMLTTTTAHLGALTPGVIYAVTAKAYTKAGSESDPSNVVTAIPRASTPSAGGSSGGCASGLAGPLSLAVLAGALGLARRLRRGSR